MYIPCISLSNFRTVYFKQLDVVPITRFPQANNYKYYHIQETKYYNVKYCTHALFLFTYFGNCCSHKNIFTFCAVCCILGGLVCFGQYFFGRFPLVTRCGRFEIGHLECEEIRQSSTQGEIASVVRPSVRLLDKGGSNAEMERYLTEALIGCFYT